MRRLNAVLLVPAVLVSIMGSHVPLAQEAIQAIASSAPICRRASHDRLVIRTGRDACGATLNEQGQHLAMGFLPTACPRPGDRYLIDADGRNDRCLRIATPKERK